MAEKSTQNVETPGLISTDQAARLLMVSAERVRQLVKAGYIPRAEKGRVLLVAAVQGYIKFLKEEERRTSKSAADSRVRDARAAEIELRIAEKNRQLVPIEDATTALDMVLASVREEFVGLPARVTRDLDLRRTLEADVNGAFERIAKSLASSGRLLAEGGDLPTAGPADDA